MTSSALHYKIVRYMRLVVPRQAFYILLNISILEDSFTYLNHRTTDFIGRKKADEVF